MTALKLENKRILVTGGAGFLGRQVKINFVKMALNVIKLQ